MRRAVPFVLASLLACGAAFAQTPAAPAPAPAPVQTLLAALGKHPAVRARFTQTRDNPALAAPQVSHGRLLFVLGHGMLWQTLDPVQETLAMRGDRVLRVGPQGQLASVRGDGRGAGMVAQMLQGLLAGDTAPVRRQFEIQASGDAAGWTLRLTPKQARMAKVLAAITLRGNAYLQGIEIALANGAQTRIVFSDSRDAGPLSTLERQALGIP